MTDSSSAPTQVVPKLHAFTRSVVAALRAGPATPQSVAVIAAVAELESELDSIEQLDHAEQIKAQVRTALAEGLISKRDLQMLVKGA